MQKVAQVLAQESKTNEGGRPVDQSIVVGTGRPWIFRSLMGKMLGGPFLTNPMYTLYHVGICWVYPRLKGSLGR